MSTLPTATPPATPTPPAASDSHTEFLPARIVAPPAKCDVPPLNPQPAKPAARSAAKPAAKAAVKPVTSTAAESDFTDDDLRAAFGPIIEASVRSAVYAKQNGIDTYLEPMLRATIRRALAEYTPASRPFQAPGTLDRFVWHVQALFTSRTYEDILFEKTRRFQVEEVFLLDASSLAMVSFASCDPARHASPRRVSGTANRLALQLRDEKGKIRKTLELSDGRHLISRKGDYVILMALVRGRAGELVFSDLEFSLRRIEDHFRDQFQEDGSALLYTLQPFIEDCLLIQSPASAA